MAIVDPPRKKVKEDAAKEFLQGAPDAQAKGKTKYARVRAGKKVQITFALPEQYLEAIEEYAEKVGQSRGFVLNMAVMHFVDEKVRKGQ